MSKKIMCLFLALLFVISSLAGCAGKGSSNEGAKDTANGEPSEINFDEEPYTINFLYLVAMEGTDQQKVNDAVNELTLKELNMKVNMIPMTFGTYMSQLPLMLSSGEDLDIFPAMANQFATYIESKYIVNCDDYAAYTKDIYEVLGICCIIITVDDVLCSIYQGYLRSAWRGCCCRLCRRFPGWILQCERAFLPCRPCLP